MIFCDMIDKSPIFSVNIQRGKKSFVLLHKKHQNIILVEFLQDESLEKINYNVLQIMNATSCGKN